MAKVLDVFKLKNGNPVLICDAKNKANFNGSIVTSVGTFAPGQYDIAEGTACFTNDPPCAVRLKTDKDCTGIKEIRFA